MEEQGHWYLAPVIGPGLDERKTRYPLSKALCGVLPRDFIKNAIFESFPAEICLVQRKDLLVLENGAKRSYEAILSESGEPYQRQPKQIHVATTFGLFMGCLRQREFTRNGFEQSPIFKIVHEFINGLQFASDPESSAKNMPQHKVDPQPKIAINQSSKASIEEITLSSMGPTKKRKAISMKSSEVLKHLHDVSDHYKESIASVLGNSLLHGNEHEQETVRETLSDIAEIAAKNLKGNQNELLSNIFNEETYGHIISSMKVPDWALLYFKLHARIPDTAWQTLLNVTCLGKSGVGLITLFLKIICV